MHVLGMLKMGWGLYTGSNFKQSILKPTADWSPYIFTLVQKVNNRVYRIHFFLSEAILCQDSASYFSLNDVYFLHGRT